MSLLPAVDHPAALLLLLLAIPIALRGRRRLGSLAPARRRAALGLRLLLLAGLSLALAGLRLDRTSTDLTVMAVVDRSESVRVFGAPPPLPASAGAAAATPTGAVEPDRALLAFLEAAAADRRPEDRFGLLTFDARPTLRMSPAPTGRLAASNVEQPAEGTDPAAALRQALAAGGDGSAALRLVLASDGNATAGDLDAAARSAAAAGVPVDVAPVPYLQTEEVMVQGVYAPALAREGQTVAVRVVLAATAPSAGTLELRHDGSPVDLNGSAPGSGLPISASSWTRSARDGADVDDLPDLPDLSDPAATANFTAALSVDVPLSRGGPASFEAIFEPRRLPGAVRPTDRVANNRATGFTQVTGPGRVLLIDNSGEGGGPGESVLARTLRARGIELDARGPSGLPTRLADFTRYDAIVFQNVPADPINPGQQELLTRYVAELGGGFVMIGGPDSFGAGGWTNSVVDRELLPVTCAIPNETILPSGALVIVIDRSGSMSSAVGTSGLTQMQIASEAAALALGTLYPQDLVGVVAFDGEAEWLAPLAPNSAPNVVATNVRGVEPRGGTNIYAGLEAAFSALSTSRADVAESGIRHVILLTDGQSGGDYASLVPAARARNITLSTIGVGDGHDRAALAELARLGGGQYHPVDDPTRLPQVFVKEARTIRQNLVKEGEFVPASTQAGSPITRDIRFDAPLRGMILTGPRPDPRIDLALTHADGEPLFAHWQVGLGRVAAFTSDASTRWAAPWTIAPGWPGYADFWTRTIRAIGRPTAARDAELLADLDGDTLRLTLEIPENDGAADRGPQTPESATVRGLGGAPQDAIGGVLLPDGTVAEVRLARTGPGRFEGSLPAPAAGNYIASLFVGGTQTGDGGEDASRAAVYGGTSRPPGAELRNFRPDVAALQRVAAITGGRVLDLANPQAAGLFARDTEFRSVSSQPITSLLLPLLVALLLIDAANRRIAWDPRATAAWLADRLSPAPAPASATATLASLRNRDRPAEAPSPAPKPARRKPAKAARTFQPTAADLAAARAAEKPAAPEARAPTAEPAADDGSTTSRLLAAKRRKQEG